MIPSHIVDKASIVCTACTTAALPTVKRARAGISFDLELAASLDKHAQTLKDLGVTRSEVVNAILAEFFDARNTSEAVWESVSRRRVRRRESG